MPTSTISHGRVTWLNIIHPDEADLEGLKKAYPAIHPLNLQDCKNELEFPKLDHFDDYVFLVMQFPYRADSKDGFRPAEVDIFIAKGILATIHRGQLTAIQDLFDRAQVDVVLREEIMVEGASPLLYHVLSELVDDCFPIVRQIQVQLQQMEDSLFDKEMQNNLAHLASLRRDIIAVKSILKPQIEVARALIEGEWPFIHDDLNPYWSDITEHLAQLGLGLDEYAEVVTGLSDTVDTLASHRIDYVVRLLTLITILTLPLTLLSTIFSMNIILPFAEHPLLFYTLIGAGIGVAVATVWYLKVHRWF